MNIKYLLRRVRFLRNIYYKIQFKFQLKSIPANVYDENIRKIRNLKGKYAGKRCFIIGNGPSLTREDLNKLSGEYTFASNRIFTVYPNTDWRPSFYAIQDTVVMDKMIDHLPDVAEQSEFAFVSSNNYIKCESRLSKADNIIWFPLRFSPPKKNSYRFSQDVSKEVFEGLTITYTCIQLAAYLGFSEIYLLGVDHNYPIEIDDDGNIIKNDDLVKAYFDDAMVSMNDINLPKVLEMTRAYLSAEKISADKGFRVYNATRGGKLEVFRRVDFDSLFG